MEARWLEVQFYILCINVLEKTQNVERVIVFIEGMTFLYNLKREDLKLLAYDFLTKTDYQPTRYEYIALAYLNKVPTRRIMQQVKIHPQAFWKIIQQHKKNPMKFYSRLAPEKHDIIKKTLETVEFLKELL